MLNVHVSRRPLATATRLVVLVAMVALTLPVALAQGRLASFTGTLLDQTDRPVSETGVVLSNTLTQARLEARTSTTGQFSFTGLAAGDYQLSVQKPGFKAYKETVTVASQDLTRTVRLQIGQVREAITVKGSSAAAAGQASPAPVSEAARQRAEQARQQVRDKCDATGASGGQIVPPTKLIDVKPQYPASLMESRVGGTVTMDATLATDGRVKDITIVASPHAELGRAASDAVRQWEFTPALLNCTPVGLSMRVTIDFVAP